MTPLAGLQNLSIDSAVLYFREKDQVDLEPMFRAFYKAYRNARDYGEPPEAAFEVACMVMRALDAPRDGDGTLIL